MGLAKGNKPEPKVKTEPIPEPEPKPVPKPEPPKPQKKVYDPSRKKQRNKHRLAKQRLKDDNAQNEKN